MERDLDKYAVAVHIPTGEIFGGYEDTKIEIGLQDVFIRDPNGITTSFKIEDSVVQPSTESASAIEIL